WHGASWNFVVWGALHGAGLAVNHAWSNVALRRGLAIPKPAAWAATFVFVMLAWVPFRAENLSSTLVLWKSLAGLNGFLTDSSALISRLVGAPFLIGILLGIALLAPNTQQLLSSGGNNTVVEEPLLWKPSMRWVLIAGLAFGAATSFIVGHRPTEFLYF